MLRMMSVTSSLTPSMAENSCRTLPPSGPAACAEVKRMRVTAAPGTELSRVRRSELPMV